MGDSEGGAFWTAPLSLIAHLVTHPYAYLAGERMALYDTLYGVSAIAFLVDLGFRRGTAGPNRYGPEPRKDNKE